MNNKQQNLIPPNDEHTLIIDTLALISQSGLSIPPIWVANFLVALKSKPLIILIGSLEASKEILVKAFCNVLTGNDSSRYQAMTGHPWWANRNENIATYTDMQSRLNSFKLETMLDEAGLPENQDRYFIAELIKISPGELYEYFSETAFQLKQGQLMRLPSVHFSEPITFPKNMTIIGTLDTVKFNWLDPDLLSQATIIDCSQILPASVQIFKDIALNSRREKSLLRSSIRDPQRAFTKLFKLLHKVPSALLPFFQIYKILQKYRSIYLGNSLVEGITYLSNSWSNSGQGLFDRDSRKNLRMALDLAITQSLLLPYSDKISKSENLKIKLYKILDDQFPGATAYLNQLTPV